MEAWHMMQEPYYGQCHRPGTSPAVGPYLCKAPFPETTGIDLRLWPPKQEPLLFLRAVCTGVTSERSSVPLPLFLTPLPIPSLSPSSSSQAKTQAGILLRPTRHAGRWKARLCRQGVSALWRGNRRLQPRVITSPGGWAKPYQPLLPCRSVSIPLANHARLYLDIC